MKQTSTEKKRHILLYEHQKKRIPIKLGLQQFIIISNRIFFKQFTPTNPSQFNRTINQITT